MYIYIILVVVSIILTVLEKTYHVSEVSTECASGLVILHHTVVVKDFSTALTNRAKESSLEGCTA